MNDERELCRRCLAGEPEALRELDGRIAGLSATDEVKQVLRVKLLTDRKLEQYGGKGPLGRWLKAVAARLAVDLTRGQKEDAVEDRVLDALLPSGPNLESQVAVRQAREFLRAAVHQALAALPDRDRLFVQHYHLDGMTLSAIGKLYDVAPSTVMRSLERSLLRVRELAREGLQGRHRLGQATLDSLVRAGVK